MANETKVFIGGSRRLSRLNADVRQRIDNVIEKRFTVFIGDANGADKAVQRYLASRHYDRVIVFCMAGECRNNIGNWPTRNIRAAERARRDFAYYAMKDWAMVDEASHGLMLWDGKSKGTLNNIINLVQQGKPVIAYLAPAKTFYTIRILGEVAHLVSKCDRSSIARFNRDLRLHDALLQSSPPRKFPVVSVPALSLPFGKDEDQ